MEMVILSC